jgi:DNA-binding transcriptional MocR family regulator
VIWVVLPEGHDSLELQRQALDAGMSIAPGPYFSPSGRYRRCLRLNCALPRSVDVETTLSRLF